MAPPAAAKGSKAGISTFGVEVRNIPVTKPTRRIPTDIAAGEKDSITNVTPLDRQVVHCETDASNQATGISVKEICRHELCDYQKPRGAFTDEIHKT